jgi:hypothetical protein
MKKKKFYINKEIKMYITMKGITDDTKYSPNIVQQNSSFLNFNNVCNTKNQYLIHNSPQKTLVEDLPQKIPYLPQKIPYLPQKTLVEDLPQKLPVGQNTTKLLPVLEPEFNLREICKQCILLEDHLSHVEKQCKDCIVKHFLALEGLSEEAVTLDNTNKNPCNIKNLAQKIRNLQKFWYENPEKTHQCSQQLRLIRKSMMEECFPIIFNENTQSCSSTQCKINNQ